jgi:CRP-like cAMP-binding protein
MRCDEYRKTEITNDFRRRSSRVAIHSGSRSPGDRTESPRMDTSISHGKNRLLSMLSSADFAALAQHAKETYIDQGALLQEADSQIEQVYFPQSGMISLLTVMRDGESVETATIGREGVVNVIAGLGGRRAASRAVMQVAGTVAQIPATSFQRLVETSAPLREIVIRCNEVHVALVQQTEGCNALHDVEKRMCRCLLQTRDRCDDDKIPLTQEFFSQMLGVQRTSVTAIARALQNAGTITYRRGKIEIIDGEELKRRSCECYETVRLRNEAVFSSSYDPIMNRG